MGILAQYIKEIGKYDLLDKEEENELIKRINCGDYEAKNKLINSNLRFVVGIARQYQNNGLPISDLIQEGNIGLIKSIEKYDPSRGYKFITYGVWWIKQTIRLALSEKSKMIRLPVNINDKLQTISSMESDEYSMKEISEMVGRDEKYINYLINISQSPISLDIMESDKDIFPYDIISDYRYNPENKINLLDGIEKLFTDNLSKKESYILKQRFGLNNEKSKYTLREIGGEYGVTKERIRQIEKKALEKLKKVPEIKELEYLVGN